MPGACDTPALGKSHANVSPMIAMLKGEPKQRPHSIRAARSVLSVGHRGSPEASAERDRQTGTVHNEARGSDDGKAREASLGEMDGNPATDRDNKCATCNAQNWPHRPACCLKRRR